MNIHRLALAALVLVLTAACSTTQAVPPVRSEFGDIQLPEGLVYLADESAFIESGTARAARLVYKSSFEPGSLVLSLQTALEGSGWRLVRGTTFPKHGTIQLYEKGEASLQVRIWEGGAFNSRTYVELSGSRPTDRPRATTATRTP